MSIIVSDIDGTLLRNGLYPIHKTIDYINELAKTNKIVLITARPEASRDVTVRALQQANINYDELMMNNIGPDHEQGLDSKKQNIQSLSDVTLAIDNDADVRAIYESLGIKTASPDTIGKVWEEVNMEKKDYSAEQRRTMARAGTAMKDGSFPIANGADLENAVRLYGNAHDPAAAKRHIISRARALGIVDQLPESWSVSKTWQGRFSW
jgi:hypothetical protein